MTTNPRRSWTPFYATRAVACYYPSEQIIELSDVNSKEARESIEQADPQLLFRWMPWLMHEARHWIDHTSTTWGQERLIGRFAALNARAADEPSGFRAIVDHWTESRRDRFAEYYSTVGTSSPLDPSPPWQYAPTIGLEFDAGGALREDWPIVFVQFRWRSGEHACRVPLSVASLLESVAIGLECQSMCAIAGGMESGARVVSQNQADKHWLDFVYEPDLGLYSVALHLVANKAGVSDIARANSMCDALASAVLDLLPEDFASMKVNESGKCAQQLERLTSGLLRRDRGVAFFVLSEWLQEGQSLREEEVVDRALDAAGVGSRSDLFDRATSEAAKRIESVSPGAYSDRLRTLLEVGLRNRRTLGSEPWNSSILSAWTNLEIAPVILGDGEWCRFGASECELFEAQAVEQWLVESTEMESRIREFVAACGYRA